MGEGRLVEQVAVEGPSGEEFVHVGAELGVVAALLHFVAAADLFAGLGQGVVLVAVYGVGGDTGEDFV